jgi:beta-mannosidase
MQAQALYLSGRIGQYRASNIFGIQIWQINEIFPTGGWGTIETARGTIPTGQLTGGMSFFFFFFFFFFLFCFGV